ncbi:low molecular weight phosphotyrosine protein phosphatase [Prosthecochloris sp. N3]|uniref:protein-tyrosine-phosphatase n=1 Tax=Prosthecochloris ethylica TaxID=2743976 RepID=A0ABR9XNX6_9CHLB|nr:low molecular weight phosphotyrosine protein phosphatase [Prosthecochloris ethylica]MBF0635587.1 low molecular weight phosphotyrosine protein phosphatase [Prosthecochloris ethylica]NUK46886.1 low molecular weight phosphotyrosine protein phosphatase [Prosthecochloris ethylica]RNA65892.1 low molecular weight phosphotyrosine protein phosphatase [Prosthecochloris sp. ZM_2]
MHSYRQRFHEASEAGRSIGRRACSVLFVCYENICRSPMAEGIFRDLIVRHGVQGVLDTASAGTVGYQAGSYPDSRARKVARRHGIDISARKAQGLDELDPGAFDWIFTMDSENYHDVRSRFPSDEDPPVYPVMYFVPGREWDDVADPYYGSEDDFLHVFRQLQTALGYIFQEISAGLVHDE